VLAPTTWVVGVDIDERAAACAASNGVPAVVGDLAAPLGDRSFDVVTAVAPYVPTAEMLLLAADVQRFEPRSAIDGGADGLEVVRGVIRSAARLLRPGGWLVTEIGGEQREPASAALSATGFDRIAHWTDEEGSVRGIRGRLSP
jgi:release factor glutamine methyltransferase